VTSIRFLRGSIDFNDLERTSAQADRLSADDLNARVGDMGEVRQRLVENDEARVALFREHLPAWWGWPWRLPRPMTIPELIAAGSLDAALAALLWVAMEHRASVIVAAGPNGAGKTVTLTALLDFLPEEVRRLHLQGMAEDFAFVADADPARTYLLANEISDHLPIYLWGRRAQRVFELLPEGFALGATLHAESVDETLMYLAAPPLSIPPTLVAAVTLVVTLAVVRRQNEWLRRIDGVFLLHTDEGRVASTRLAAWDTAHDRHECFLQANVHALTARLRAPADSLLAAQAERTEWLSALVTAGQLAPAAFRAALADYDASRRRA
jgi:hypothetical protein